MSEIQSKEDLKKIISEGELKKALMYLLENAKGFGGEVYNETILLSARYNKLMEEKISETIDKESLRIGLNNLNQSFLEIVDKAPEAVLSNRDEEIIRNVVNFQSIGDWEDSIVLINRLVNSKPNVSYYRYLAAKGYYYIANFEKCVQNLNAAILADSKQYSYYKLRGHAHLALGNLTQFILDSRKALDLLDKIILNNPTQTYAYYQRVIIFADVGNNSNAIKDIKEALPGFDKLLEIGSSLQTLDGIDLLKDENLLLEADGNDLEIHSYKARAYYILRDYSKAIAEYNRCLMIAPKRHDFLFFQAQIWFDSLNYEKSWKAIQNAMQPGQTWPGYLQLRAQLYINKRDYAMAKNDLDTALEQSPDHPALYIFRGSCYLNMKEPDLAQYDLKKKAITICNDLISQGVDFSIFLFWRGLAWFYLAEFPKAIEDFTASIEKGYKDVYIFTWKGIAQLYTNQYSTTLSDAKEILALNEEDFNGHFLEGSALNLLGKQKEAVVALNKAIEHNPNFDRSYTERSKAYLYLGDSTKALADADTAIRRNPESAEHYIQRGRVSLAKKEYELALQDFQFALETMPEMVDVYLAKADLFEVQEKYAEAIEAVNQALNRQPETLNAFLLNRIALLFFKTEEANKALVQLEKTLTLHPNDLEALTIRANFYLENDDYANAILDYEKLAQLDPKNYYYRRCMALCLARTGREEEALVVYDEAIALNPNEAELFVLRAVALARIAQRTTDDTQKQDHFSRSIKALDLALQINPQYAQAWRERGVIKAEMGSYDEAIANLSTAIQWNPNAGSYFADRAFIYHYHFGEIEKAKTDLQKAIALGYEEAQNHLNEIEK